LLKSDLKAPLFQFDGRNENPYIHAAAASMRGQQP